MTGTGHQVQERGNTEDTDRMETEAVTSLPGDSVSGRSDTDTPVVSDSTTETVESAPIPTSHDTDKTHSDHLNNTEKDVSDR